MKDLDSRVSLAIRHFWVTRRRQGQQQGRTGRRDRGARTAVTGGAQLDEFVELIAQCLIDNDIPKPAVYRKRNVVLPGFFRPTKDWDLLVVVDGYLLATIECKAHIGPSFGNNFNNRAEEAVGNATDLWTAYREGAFAKSPRPWLGYLILLEETKRSTSPVRVSEPHFKVFPDFRGASYSTRWQLLCQRLVRERLYDAAAFILSDQESGLQGRYREPSEELSFENFMRSLTASAIAYARARRDRK
jgi:hypothetical protein